MLSGQVARGAAASGLLFRGGTFPGTDSPDPSFRRRRDFREATGLPPLLSAFLHDRSRDAWGRGSQEFRGGSGSAPGAGLS